MGYSPIWLGPSRHFRNCRGYKLSRVAWCLVRHTHAARSHQGTEYGGMAILAMSTVDATLISPFVDNATPAELSSANGVNSCPRRHFRNLNLTKHQFRARKALLPPSCAKFREGSESVIILPVFLLPFLTNCLSTGDVQHHQITADENNAYIMQLSLSYYMLI